MNIYILCQTNHQIINLSFCQLSFVEEISYKKIGFFNRFSITCSSNLLNIYPFLSGLFKEDLKIKDSFEINIKNFKYHKMILKKLCFQEKKLQPCQFPLLYTKEYHQKIETNLKIYRWERCLVVQYKNIGFILGTEKDIEQSIPMITRIIK